MLAFRSVRESLQYKHVDDNHEHVWDQCKWAFDLVVSPHAGPADLQIADRALIGQARTSGLPDSDIEVALEVVDRAIAKEEILGAAPTGPYAEPQEGGGARG